MKKVASSQCFWAIVSLRAQKNPGIKLQTVPEFDEYLDFDLIPTKQRLDPVSSADPKKNSTLEIVKKNNKNQEANLLGNFKDFDKSSRGKIPPPSYPCFVLAWHFVSSIWSTPVTFRKTSFLAATGGR